MDRAVVAKLPRQPVPAAAGVQVIEDTTQRQPLRNALATGDARWVVLVQDVLAALPDIVGNLPTHQVEMYRAVRNHVRPLDKRNVPDAPLGHSGQ